MVANFASFVYIGGGTGSGPGQNVIIGINEAGLTPVEEVMFEVEEVSAFADMEFDLQQVTITEEEKFTVFLEEETTAGEPN